MNPLFLLLSVVGGAIGLRILSNAAGQPQNAPEVNTQNLPADIANTVPAGENSDAHSDVPPGGDTPSDPPA